MVCTCFQIAHVKCGPQQFHLSKTKGRCDDKENLFSCCCRQNRYGNLQAQVNSPISIQKTCSELLSRFIEKLSTLDLVWARILIFGLGLNSPQHCTFLQNSSFFSKFVMLPNVSLWDVLQSRRGGIYFPSKGYVVVGLGL